MEGRGRKRRETRRMKRKWYIWFKKKWHVADEMNICGFLWSVFGRREWRRGKEDKENIRYKSTGILAYLANFAIVLVQAALFVCLFVYLFSWRDEFYLWTLWSQQVAVPPPGVLTCALGKDRTLSYTRSTDRPQSMGECLRSIYRFEVGRLTDSGLSASNLHEKKNIAQK